MTMHIYLFNLNGATTYEYHCSGIQPISKEVEAESEVTISCIVTGISQQLNTIVWTKEGNDVTTLSDSSYITTPGIYSSNSQTTTLTVKAAANTADSTYTCVIASDEWLVNNLETTVTLEVFCKK